MTIDNRTKLLIVDDLPDNLKALTKIIEQDDRIVYQAKSGEAALALLLEHEFALAILDVMMPDMNGFELAELMRGAEKTRNIPIVFVSAGGKELNFSFKGYETGAVDFLHKPLDISAVKSKVSVFVSIYQQRNEVRRQVEALEKSQKELHATQIELQHALQMRDEFMSMVGHELRTPLNTLHVETQIRQMQLSKDNTETFSRERLEAMFARDSRQIQSMIRLINDMNDVTRIQNGKLSILPIETNLSELLRRIIDDLSQQATAAGCAFLVDIQDGVKGVWDEFRIEQIIINLLTNALRYGQSRPVNITLVANGNSAEIIVHDQGIGISLDEQKRIFDKFERGDVKKVCDGLGMGLFIARQLAEAHQGTLSVESVLGEGSTFRLRLPF